MRNPTVHVVGTLAVVLALVVLTTGFAGAFEQQLAGMRLGQHAINLLDVYGQPDGVVVGGGPEFAAAGGAPTAEQLPGAGGPSPLMGAPTAGMPGGVGAPGPGAMAPPGGAVPGAAPGAPPGAPPGAGGAPGAVPGAAPGGEAPGGAAATSTSFPLWAFAVWMEMRAGQVEWIYNKGPVVLGFVLDRDGYIDSITVAAEECDYARTALWRPHQTIKLGDDFKRVLYRYGYPDEEIPFVSSGPGPAVPYAGPITVTFGGTSRVFSRDMVIRYTEHNNIAFTVHNMKVTRIQIWNTRTVTPLPVTP